MAVFSISGRTAATSGAVNQTVFQVWNNDGNARILLREMGLYAAGDTGSSVYVSRSTARGTAGSTVTPDADNGWDGDDVPPAATLLDLASFSVQPTFASPPLFGWQVKGTTAVTGSNGWGWVWTLPRDLVIPPGTGIAIVERISAVCPASDVYAVWEEQ